MLAVAGGDLWLLSTPNGKRGFFYENWVNGDTNKGDDVGTNHSPRLQCPEFPNPSWRRNADQLGNQWFRQEYLCEFTTTIAKYSHANW